LAKGPGDGTVHTAEVSDEITVRIVKVDPRLRLILLARHHSS
jgi:hypothetical protein